MIAKPEAHVSVTLFETGIGTVIVARPKSGGRVEAGVFLVDVYCLGVKDAWLMAGPAAEYDELLERYQANYPLSPHPAAYGRKLVEEAVRYARDLGLPPHRDYKRAARVFGGIDPAACTATFTFGLDGKPFFMVGPSTSPAQAKRIIEHLRAKCGEGNFHYLVGFDDPGDDDSDDDVADDWADDVDDGADDADDADAPPMLAFSDSAADGAGDNPDLDQFAAETLAAMPDGDKLHPVFADSDQANVAAELLSMLMGFWERSAKIAPELTLQQAMTFMATMINLTHSPEESRQDVLAAAPAEQGRLLESLTKMLTPEVTKSCPPIIVANHRLLEAGEGTGRRRAPRLLLAFMTVADADAADEEPDAAGR